MSAKPQVKYLFLFPLLVWLDFICFFSKEWSLNPQYEYGFVVPLFVAYLLYLRQSEKPLRQSSCVDYPRTALCLLVIAIVLNIPLKLIIPANPDWRLTQWIFGLSACFLTGAYGYYVWGNTWIKHYMPAFALFLFSIPWPVQFEDQFIQDSMKQIASISVEVLNLMGIYAQRQGNIIHISKGFIGIEEACSGIRSLQSTLMSAYFLGELFQFTSARRLLLMGLGALVSLILNLMRTLTLTLLTHYRGSDYMSQLHDPVGNLVSIIAFFILLGMAGLIRHFFLKSNVLPQNASQAISPTKSNLISPSLLWLLMISYAFTTLGSACYYQIRQPSDSNYEEIEIDWERLGADLHFEPISPSIKTQLRYTEGKHAIWTDAKGNRWTLFYFKWEKPTISSFVGVHHPSTCLPAAGFKTSEPTYSIKTQFGRHKLNIDYGLYELNQKPFHVFYSFWDINPDRTIPLVRTAKERIQIGLSGYLMTGRRSIEIIISPKNPETFDPSKELKAWMDRVLYIN